MSKELLNVKKDGMKSKIVDLLIIFITVLIGVGIICFSFFASYNKKTESLAVEEKESKTIIDVEENKNENIKAENVVENETENSLNQNEKKSDTNAKSDNNTKKDNTKSKKDDTKSITEAKKNQKLPVWTDTAIQDIKDIYGSDEKQVYLTFDDGPSTEITPQILEILEEENVPATFFVLGKCVDSHPELVKQEYEAGHFIANHGYTHTYSQIYASIDNVINEYNQTNESIKKAIGNEKYDCHLFRFPGGSSGGPYDSLKAQAKQYLAENNVASTNWNCLTSDAAGNTTVDAQYKGALETQGSHTSLIILMHDAADKKATPETLKLLIKHYKEEGYEFKNFYEIFNNDNVEEKSFEENNQENM